MSRRGAPRKEGKRTKGGRLKERKEKPDKIEPTPEMKKRKRSIGGQEVGNPLSYLDLSDAQREALSKYFSICRSAAPERRVGLKTSSLKDFIAGGGADYTDDDQRDIAAKMACEAAQAVLNAQGKFVFVTVEFIRLSTSRVNVSERYHDALTKGANALMGHFHIREEKAE